MGIQPHIPHRREHQTLGAQRLAARSEDYWDFQPSQRVRTTDGFLGVVIAVHDGPLPGLEEYQVELDGGLGGGAYTSSQLRPAAAATAAAGRSAAADYPELAEILAQRPDPARQQVHASAASPEPPAADDDEIFDPACAYSHEGPCPEWPESPRTALLHRHAMPAKSGRPVKGEFHYEIEHDRHYPRRLVGYINGKPAGYIRHTAFGGESDDDHEAVKVHMLHTSEQHRGTGIASAMMDALYHHYPNAWINHGFRTDDGSRWWNGYDEPDPSRNVHNFHPEEAHPRLDHHWTDHFDQDDVVENMNMLQETNDELGHEGNEHRQWDHTEYGGRGRRLCGQCDRDMDHQCSECGDHYPHRSEGDHRCCEQCDHDLEHECVQCGDYYPHSDEGDHRCCEQCDHDLEHECPHCGDYTKHSDATDHEEGCDENPENCEECDEGGDHHCSACQRTIPHDEADLHPKDAAPHGANIHPFHRGFALNLQPHDHEIVHDSQRPASERAHHLVNQVIGRDSMPSNAWSLHEGVAEGHSHYGPTGAFGGGNTNVKLHAAPLDAREQVGEHGSASHSVDSKDTVRFRGNHTQPLRLSGISWRRSGHSTWTRHDFAGQGLPVSIPAEYGRTPLPPTEHPTQPQQAPAASGEQMKLFSSLVTLAAKDPDFRFHVTAAWKDVIAKAKRIRSEGGVRVTLASDGLVFAEVKGDHHVYETGLQRLPGRMAAHSWSCGCKWGAYHWGADDDFSRFAGRMCSHALALQYEAQSRGMFGRDIVADDERPSWVPRKVVVRYDIDSDAHQLARSSALKPMPVSATDSVIRRLAATVLAAGEDRGEIMLALAAAGIAPGPGQRALQHQASVDAPFGEPAGTAYQLPKAPGATQRKQPWENPASAGPLAAADPAGWNRKLPLEAFASSTVEHSLFEPGGAEALLEEEPDGALPETDGVQIPSNDEALTPPMTAALRREALKDFTLAERQALIDEGQDVEAANLDRLEIEGTHYADLEKLLSAQEEDMAWLS